MINRLIEPTSGKVVIDGQNASAIAGHVLRRRIGYVFQRIGLFPHLTIEENIRIPLDFLKWEDSRVRRRVNELLDIVELEPSLLRRRPAQLSGGQQQRVGVARALAAEPKLMLLDEPFGALDPLTRDRLQQSFLKIKRQLKLTAVFVTHDLYEAILVADEIAVLNEGALVQIGTAQQLLQSPANPYVERLLETPRRQARTFSDLMMGTA